MHGRGISVPSGQAGRRPVFEAFTTIHQSRFITATDVLAAPGDLQAFVISHSWRAKTYLMAWSFKPDCLSVRRCDWEAVLWGTAVPTQRLSVVGVL